MNEARKNDQLQPMYPPQYINAAYVEDEINLVDVWVALLSYKRIFLVIFSVLFSIGLLIALFVYEEKFTLTTAIQIGTVGHGGSITQIESTESLKSKLNSALIPKITGLWLKNDAEMTVVITNVSSAKGSDIVLIQNKIKNSELDQFSKFHALLTAEVISDHESLTALSQTDLQAELASANAKLTELEDPLTLKSIIDKQLLELNTEKTKLSRLEESYELYKKGGTGSVLQLLTSEEREQLLPQNGKVDSQILNIRFEKFLLDNQILQDEQQQKIKQINLSINDLKLDQANQIQDQRRVISSIGSKIEKSNKTRIISEPILSLKPSGMSQSLLIILVLFLAGFAGFSVMLIAMFRDKVNERLLDIE